MKSLRVIVCIFAISFIFTGLSYAAERKDAGWSFLVKPGVYFPESSQLDKFNEGPNIELGVAYNFNRCLALEGGIGTFYTEDTFRTSGTVNGFSASYREKFEIYTVPLTLSVKGIIPVNKWDFYALGGVGAYFAYAELRERFSVDGLEYRRSGDDTDVVFGAHLGVGVNYNITPTFFVGAEGKYLWTDKAKMSDDGISTKFRLDGIQAMGVIGFRF